MVPLQTILFFLPMLLEQIRGSFLLLHELDGLAGVRRIQERQHYGTELLEVDWLGHVAVESCVYALGVNISHDVGGQGHDREIRLFVLLLPLTDLPASLVAVLVRHVKIALRFVLVVLVIKQPERAYQNDGIISVRIGKHLFGALDTIQDCVDLNVNLAEEFKQDLHKIVSHVQIGSTTVSHTI